jgi:hypothetical protein
MGDRATSSGILTKLPSVRTLGVVIAALFEEDHHDILLCPELIMVSGGGCGEGAQFKIPQSLIYPIYYLDALYQTH